MKKLYPSSTESFTAGKAVYWEPWVPAEGPTGRRNVIEGILVRASAQLDVATATLQGENLARLLNRILIKDIGGVRWDTTGEGARMFLSTLLMGPQYWHEEADLSTGNDQAVEYAMYIPFAKPHLHRAYDFAMAADVFAGMQITHPAQDTLDIGSSAVTIDSNDITLWAVCREEDTVEHKARDVVMESELQTTSQTKIWVPGAYIAEILAYSTGDAGASMAGWDSHSIDKIQPDVMTEDDYLQLYRLMRKVGDHGATPGGEIYNDPVVLDKARVIYASPDIYDDKKLADMPYHNGQLLIRATNSVSAATFVHRFIEPKSEKLVKKVNALYNIDPASERVKTAHKTRRSLGFWDRLAPFMPTSVRSL